MFLCMFWGFGERLLEWIEERLEPGRGRVITIDFFLNVRYSQTYIYTTVFACLLCWG